jgi:hypothetical protein
MLRQLDRPILRKLGERNELSPKQKAWLIRRSPPRRARRCAGRKRVQQLAASGAAGAQGTSGKRCAAVGGAGVRKASPSAR